MLRTLPTAKRAARHTVGFSRLKQARQTRPFSKSQVVAEAASSSSQNVAPKKRGFFRTLGLYSTGFVVLFYATAPAVAVNNSRFNAFFTESVPFGERIMNVVEDQNLDDKLRLDFLTAGREKLQKVFDSVSKKAADAPSAAERTEAAKVAAIAKAEAARLAASNAASKVKESDAVTKVKEKVKDTKERAKEIVDTVKTKTSKASQKVMSTVAPVEKVSEITERPKSFSEGVEDLVKRAEGALSGKYVDILPEATTTPEQPAGAPPDTMPKPNDATETSLKDLTTPAKEENIYPDLPVGFEPPPGYSRPKLPGPTPASSKSADKESGSSMPTVPSLDELTASEPVLSELASTIDSLTKFVSENPESASSVKGILENAKADLKHLTERMNAARAEERAKLETQIDEQAREYTLKLLELEMASQDKLDEQELEFKAFFEDERRKMTQTYRQKLEHELQTQSEIINERLKAEVVAQGIELQRRWIRDIKVRVEQERGGRLARLEELATNLKRLERLALDNAEYLDENLRLHATWAALRALTASTVDSPVRRPFRDELRVLRHAARSSAPSSGASDAEKEETKAVVQDVLESIERTDVPDIGVEPLADLTTWFTTSVAPQVARVSLVPEHDAGVLSYLASHLLSSFRFSRHGYVEGSDVLSVLARAEYYMNEKDLDSAARELNQLRGAAKELLSDWLEAARRRLEVQQALEVIQAQTALDSLRVV